MRKIYFLIPAVLSTSVSALSFDDLSYTSLELDYVNLNIEGFDNQRDLLRKYNDGDGWGFRVSFGFSDSWFAFSNYSSAESEVGFIDDFDQFFNSNTDIERLDIGIGFHRPFNDRTDLVIKGAYTDYDIGSFNFGETGSDSLNDLQNDSSDGFFVDLSLRSQLTQRIEGSLGGRYTDIERVDDFSIVGNLLYEISPSMGVNLGLDLGGELTTWVLGIRLSF